MYHLNKTSRYLSYLGTSFLIGYFILSAYEFRFSLVFLLLPAIWFFGYAVIMARNTATNTYYKFFIFTNLIAILFGFALYFGLDSKGGFTMLIVSLSMLAMVVTLSKLEGVSSED